MMLRMMSAFWGTRMPSAFSTARTEASACTVVQTPQMRSQNAQASRGSRPSRITSMPRHMVPEDHGIVNHAAVVEHGFDAQVAFDAGDRIDYDSSGHGSLLLAARLVLALDCLRAVAHQDRGKVRGRAHCRDGDQRLADLVGSGLDARHRNVGQPPVERAVVPEVGLAAPDAAVAGTDGP